MSFGSNVVVLNPPELAQDILKRHQEAVAVQLATLSKHTAKEEVLS